MGDHEDLPKSNGLLMPNGLRPSEAAPTVTRTLDAERWSLVEERTSELIARIQPNKPSEERRIAVANYVQQLIKKCFPCQVFTFGSVPLKTYLPDGDIDLTAFSKNLDLKDTWANEVREILEHEEKSKNAEFRVKEVQYIKAEVKIIKCLVENIVVDISFNQLGGLCTLCFLEEIDHLINQDHLFKRSIILIKAWCYYESRILGAHHGLLSTYALETLVLYIFHVFNNSFAGPLEVLYRFLEFFSKFDWENFCVSLWGPVPISSLPDTTAEPPRKDGGDLLLSRIFLDACSAVYAVFPSGHDTQGQPFVSKHFNVIDPLRINNNLGRSVSKGNFYRIRSAFAFGAKRLAGLLECPNEDIIAEVDKFFANTRQRHGSGNRPDAPASIPLQPQPPNSDPNEAFESCKNQGNMRKKTETAGLRPGHQFLTDASASLSDSLSQQAISGTQNPPNVNRTTSPSGSQSQKAYSCQTSYRVLDQSAKNISSNETVHKERFKSHSKPCQFSNDYVGHGKLQFARTHSSPELSGTSAQILSRSRRSAVPDIGKNHFISSKPNINSRKTFGPDVLGCQNARLVNDALSPKYNSSHQNRIPTPDSNCIPNNFHDNTGVATMGEELASASQALEMHQEEQDMVNMMSSRSVNGLVQQLQLPISFTTHQFPVPSPILRPVGYSQKNIGVIPANVPVAPWPPQFSQGFVPPSLSSYFSNAQLETSSEEALESGNDTSSMTELNQEDADYGCWPEQETASSVGFIPPDRNFQNFNSNDKKGPFGGFDFIPLSQISNPNVPFMRDHARIARENINMDRSSHDDPTMHQNMRETDVYASNRSTDTKLHASRASSSRSMVADSWDGPSIKAPKLPRDRWGRKPAPYAASSTSYGNTKSWRWYEDSSLDHASISRDDDIGEWINESSSSNEVTEPSDSMSQICGSQPPPGPEPTLMSGSDSVLPIAPMFLCAGPRQRSGNSSGSVFYPTGPPVPFYMLPVYKFPSDSGASDGTLEQFNGLDANRSNPLVRDVDSNEKSEQAEVPVSTSVIDDVSSEPFVERKSDILNGDFSSHWQNLQYGRLCQDRSVPGPPIYPAPIVVPPMYFQGHYPLDGPGRPFSANANLLPVMSYSPRILQVMPLQAGSVRPELFQRYGDEAPSFRGGTGTFLPKAKIPLRDRPPGTRNHRASYNSDRSDHGDREGSWNSRAPNRSHGHGQRDKPNTRPDRLPAVDNRTDRSWDSHKNERAIPNHQNNSLSSTCPSHGPANMTYGMYPIASMNSDNTHPSGTPIPSFVMLCSCNHPNLGYGSSSEPVEFGSLGPMHLSNINEIQPPNNGGVPRNAFEPRHQQGSECSSPDQPSSPHIRRRV